MSIKKFLWPLILSALLAALALISYACSPNFASRTLVDVQSEISTAVAATVDGYVVATQQAATPTAETVVLAEAEQQNPSPTPTATPLPTATPTAIPPTTAPLPTSTPVTASSAAPKIFAKVNTNCRVGPSTRYYVDGYLVVGLTSEVYGRDPKDSWWYIRNPTKEDKRCWVWNETTSVEGDTSSIPVVAAPPLPEVKTKYYCDPWFNCYDRSYYCGKEFWKDNYCWNWKPPKCKTQKVKWCDPVYWWKCKIIEVNPCKDPWYYKTYYYENCKNPCQNKCRW
jgi:hypothetical protein